MLMIAGGAIGMMKQWYLDNKHAGKPKKSKPKRKRTPEG
jgi:hypothetical protein